MTTRVKICGLKTEVALDSALTAGADMIGLVFHGKSPRNVSVEAARALADRARGKAQIVALVVDPTDEILQRLADAIRPDIFQLHGEETPDRVTDVRAQFAVPVMKAISVGSRADAERARAYAGRADLILFDAKAPVQSTIPGGNGEIFDWALIDAVKDVAPWVLSGGLTPDNVASAIRATGAGAVDVSSGVERTRGVKDPDLIRAFIEAAKRA